jgi:hypothetical protein
MLRLSRLKCGYELGTESGWMTIDTPWLCCLHFLEKDIIVNWRKQNVTSAMSTEL